MHNVSSINTDVAVCVVIAYAVQEEYDADAAASHFTVAQLKQLELAGIEVRVEHGSIPIGVVVDAYDKTISKHAVFHIYPTSSPLALSASMKVATGVYPDVSLGQTSVEYVKGCLIGKRAVELSVCSKGRRFGTKIIDFFPSVYTLRTLSFNELVAFAETYQYPPPSIDCDPSAYCDLLIAATARRQQAKYPAYALPSRMSATHNFSDADGPPPATQPEPTEAPAAEPSPDASGSGGESTAAVPEDAPVGEKRPRDAMVVPKQVGDLPTPDLLAGVAAKKRMTAQLKEILSAKDEIEAQLKAEREKNAEIAANMAKAQNELKEINAAKAAAEEKKFEGEVQEALRLVTAIVDSAPMLYDADPVTYQNMFPGGIDAFKQKAEAMIRSDPGNVSVTMQPLATSIHAFSAKCYDQTSKEYDGVLQRLSESLQRHPTGASFQPSPSEQRAIPKTIVEPPARSASFAHNSNLSGDARPLPPTDPIESTPLTPSEACDYARRHGLAEPSEEQLRKYEYRLYSEKLSNFSSTGKPHMSRPSMRPVLRDRPLDNMDVDSYNPKLFRMIDDEVSARNMFLSMTL